MIHKCAGKTGIALSSPALHKPAPLSKLLFGQLSDNLVNDRELRMMLNYEEYRHLVCRSAMEFEIANRVFIDEPCASTESMVGINPYTSCRAYGRKSGRRDVRACNIHFFEYRVSEISSVEIRSIESYVLKKAAREVSATQFRKTKIYVSQNRIIELGTDQYSRL